MKSSTAVQSGMIPLTASLTGKSLRLQDILSTMPAALKNSLSGDFSKEVRNGICKKEAE